jgi:hypothetical protein
MSVTAASNLQHIEASPKRNHSYHDELRNQSSPSSVVPVPAPWQQQRHIPWISSGPASPHKVQTASTKVYSNPSETSAGTKDLADSFEG